MNEDATVYLLHCADVGAAAAELGPDADVVPLAEGLAFVESDLDRSQLYHRVKHVQPDGSPLLVAPLDRAPKFMGMADGSTAWLRGRLA